MYDRNAKVRNGKKIDNDLPRRGRAPDRYDHGRYNRRDRCLVPIYCRRLAQKRQTGALYLVYAGFIRRLRLSSLALETPLGVLADLICLLRDSYLRRSSLFDLCSPSSSSGVGYLRHSGKFRYCFFVGLGVPTFEPPRKTRTPLARERSIGRVAHRSDGEMIVGAASFAFFAKGAGLEPTSSRLSARKKSARSGAQTWVCYFVRL